MNDPDRRVHTVTDQCSCPIGHDHTDQELRRNNPELWTRMHDPDRPSETTYAAADTMQAKGWRWAEISPDEYLALPLGTPVRVTFPAGQSYRIGAADSGVRIERIADVQ